MDLAHAPCIYSVAGALCVAAIIVAVTETDLRRVNPLDLLRRRTGLWRWLAVVVALAFALLVSTAATHHHPAGQDRDCAICAAVVHAVSDTVAPVAVPIASYVLLYAVERTPTAPLHYAASVPFPCICGPPSQTC